MTSFKQFLGEGAVADRYEELKDTAAGYAPYMYISARPAGPDEIGTALPAIKPGPTTSGERFVKKGMHVARILQTGKTKTGSSVDLYVLDKKAFSLFSQLDRKPDIEGFQEYETYGDNFEVVKDGSEYILKKGKQITKIPAALFDKQFRKLA